MKRQVKATAVGAMVVLVTFFFLFYSVCENGFWSSVILSLGMAVQYAGISAIIRAPLCEDELRFVGRVLGRLCKSGNS